MTQLKVLIPLDGSKLAEASLSYVSSLRALGEVKLMLFSVVAEDEETRALDIDESIKREHNVLSSYLREVAADLAKHLGLQAETRIAAGNPAERILQAAQDFDANLIVISTHGRSGPSRWRRGSTADKIIRTASCNVMVLGPNAAESAEWFAEISMPFQQVLVPLDGSTLAESALPFAERIAERYASNLHLVRTVTVPVYGDISGGDASYPDLLGVMSESAEVYLEGIKKRDQLVEGTTCTVKVGGAATELRHYIDDHHIDLVVMTTHGRGGLSRATLGSVTDRLLESAVPVLVVKAPGD